MTTQTTTIQPRKQGVRTLIGMTAASLAVLGGALLWQVRPTSEPAAPATTTVSTMNEDAAPLGGLAELYREQQRDTAAREAARVTTSGGLAELYAEQEAEARASAAQQERMGGMAELYRDQMQHAGSAR